MRPVPIRKSLSKQGDIVNKEILIAPTLALLFGSAYFSPVWAAEGDDAVIEEISVTARKRSENMQDVPIAMQAFTREQIDQQNLASIEDFIELVPTAFIAESGFGLSDVIVIRGVGGLNVDFLEQATGIYRDGYYIGGTRTVFSDSVDLERVEVLRGPQGALYGRNAVGGAINFVYRQPDVEKSGGELDLRYGEHDRSEIRATYNLAVSDSLAFRVNGWYSDQNEGEYYNVTLGDYADQVEMYGFRAAMKYAPSSDFDLSLQLETNSEDGYENVSAFDGTSGSETKKTIERDTESDADRDWLFAGATARWGTSFGDVSLLASFRDSDVNTVGDQDFSADPDRHSVITRDEQVENTFVELRWASPESQALMWMTGLTYFTEAVDIDRLNQAFTPTAGISNGIINVDTDSVSAWGELIYSASDKLELSFSARYTDEEKNIDLDQIVTIGGLMDVTLPGLDTTFTNTSFGVGISYRPTENYLLYAKVGEAFRAGGFNTLLTNAAASLIENATNEELAALLDYEDETGLNIEVGVKSTWSRGTVNLAVYRLKQQDYIQGLFAPGTFYFVYDNLGDATTDGAEVDFMASLTENLTLNGSVGWVDANLDEPSAFGSRSIIGGKSNTANLGLNYNVPVSGNLDLLLRTDWRHRYDRSGNSADGVDFQVYSIVNAGVGLQSERWSISLNVDNISDDDYAIAGLLPVFPGPNAIVRQPGRTWTAKFTTRF